MAFRFFILSVALSALVLSPASAQISTPPCTPSMITTFTPCMNFVSNSSFNGTGAPSADCCNSLKSLMSSGKDCLCLIATGSVPFRVPINQSVAMNLPRACNMPGVPLQCKAAGAPVPAPGPAAFGPASSPNAASPPQAAAATPAEAQSPTSTPVADTPPTTPAGDATPATPTNGGATSTPTNSTGSRAGVTPSAACPMYTMSPLLFVNGIFTIAFKYY